MTIVHFTAEVKAGLLLELPDEAQNLHLQPGDKVEVQLDLPATRTQEADKDPTIALLESWLAEDATNDPDELRQAEADLIEFKRNMNAPRKEAGARLHYPEVE